jgi:hypothetical protein
MTDCSPQLQSAVLTTFATGGETLTRLVFGNVVLVHLFYFDGVARTVARCSEELKSTAKMVMKSLEGFGIVVFMHECKSHVYRAPKTYVHKHKAPEIVREKIAFESMVTTHSPNPLTPNQVGLLHNAGL